MLTLRLEVSSGCTKSPLLNVPPPHVQIDCAQSRLPCACDVHFVNMCVCVQNDSGYGDAALNMKKHRAGEDAVAQ